MKLKLGTRTSKMAMHQAELVKSLLVTQIPHAVVEIVPIKSEGDVKNTDKNIFDGKGVFIKKLDQALLKGEIDFAVNCMKDIPNDHERSEEIGIMAVLPREDVRDTLVLREGLTLDAFEKKHGCSIGTSAPRRRAILQKLYPHCALHEIRGSSDTRIRKLDEGIVDAIVLAKAGLERINLQHRISKIFDPNIFLPAIGAGIITMDALKNNFSVTAILQSINHEKTYHEMLIERAFLNKINGDCHTAIGGYIRYVDESVDAQATVFSPNDAREFTARVMEKTTGKNLENLGTLLADKILSQQNQ